MDKLIEDLTTDLLAQVTEVCELDVTKDQHKLDMLRTKFFPLAAAKLTAARAAGAASAVNAAGKQHLAATILSGMAMNMKQVPDERIEGAIEAAGKLIEQLS